MYVLRRSVNITLIFSTILAVGAGGCGKMGAGHSADARVKAGNAPKTGITVSDEDCRAFADRTQEEVAMGDSARFASEIDWEAILEAATAGIPAPEAARKGFIGGARTSILADNRYVKEILETTRDGGAYTFLRIFTRDKRKGVLFRMISADGAINYHFYILAKRDDKVVRAVDVYTFLSAEFVSQPIRRLYAYTATHSSRGILDRLRGSEQAFLKEFPQFQQLMTAQAQGRPQDALKIYDGLSEVVKNDKTVQLIRLRAADAAGETLYETALEDFRRRYPNDPCVDMISIDYFTMKKDYPKALECLGHLDKSVHGDPYLHVLRAGVSLLANDLVAAEDEVRKAIAEDPTLQQAYDSLIVVTLRKNDFDGTLSALKALHDNFGTHYEDMTKLPEFSEFVKSPQYRTWQTLDMANAERSESDLK
ncbi:tetratricopeptide repeat protein [Singulisphaera rosea]